MNETHVRLDAERIDLDKIERDPWPFPGQRVDLADEMGIDSEPQWLDKPVPPPNRFERFTINWWPLLGMACFGLGGVVVCTILARLWP